MRILALETTERIGSVALADAGAVIAANDLPSDQRSAQSLAPAVRELLATAQWKPADVDLVAVSRGPGSFTGVRVGITMAKTFAYASEARTWGVDTLEALALRAAHLAARFHVAIDAQRGDVVVRGFEVDSEGWPRPLDEPRLVGARAWLAELPPGSVVSGPVLRKLKDAFPEGVRITPAEAWRVTATEVARLAARDGGQAADDSPWTLRPCYSRPSAAEEKWAARES